MPTHVHLADDDPVIRLLRVALEGPTNVSADWVRAFFAPEPGDPLAKLRQIAAETGWTNPVRVTCGKVGSENEMLETIETADLLFLRRGEVTAPVIAKAGKLRLIQRLGARSDVIDLPAAKTAGIPVSCLPRRSLALTAEHALLLMLALAKRLPEAHTAVIQGRYDPSQLSPIDNVCYNWVGFNGIQGLYGKTLGIIGLGEVGSLLADRAAAFGMRIQYHNRRRLPNLGIRPSGIVYAELDELLTESDFIVLLAQDIPENVGMIGRAQFACMRPSSFFVNVSRGRLVDESALAEALISGRIAGAGLDVHKVEPRPVGDRLAALSNIVMTPHFAGGSRYGLLDEIKVLLANGRAALDGGSLQFLVSASEGGLALG